MTRLPTYAKDLDVIIEQPGREPRGLWEQQGIFNGENKVGQYMLS